MTSDITDREFFESVKTERAETLRHWMGKEDFFIAIGLQKMKTRSLMPLKGLEVTILWQLFQ